MTMKTWSLKWQNTFLCARRLSEINSITFSSFPLAVSQNLHTLVASSDGRVCWYCNNILLWWIVRICTRQPCEDKRTIFSHFSFFDSFALQNIHPFFFNLVVLVWTRMILDFVDSVEWNATGSMFHYFVFEKISIFLHSSFQEMWKKTSKKNLKFIISWNIICSSVCSPPKFCAFSFPSCFSDVKMNS